MIVLICSDGLGGARFGMEQRRYSGGLAEEECLIHCLALNEQTQFGSHSDKVDRCL